MDIQAHLERVEAAKEMQRVALTNTNPLARPVVIGDIVEELNARAKSYIGYSCMSVEESQDRALFDFSKYTHAAIERIPDAKGGDSEFFRYTV